MQVLSTLLAPGRPRTSSAAVSIPLTLKTAQRVRNEWSDFVSQAASVQVFREPEEVESERQEAGVAPLTIAERGHATDVCHLLSGQTLHDFLLSHVAEFGGKDGSSDRVAGRMKRDGHGFVTEDFSVEQQFGLNSFLGLYDQCAVCGCFMM